MDISGPFHGRVLLYFNFYIKTDFKMEIDSTTIVISVIASLFFIVPIVIDQLKKKKKENEES